MTDSMPAAIVFDWGDTLMTTFPEYDGVMAEWPRVAAEPGAAQMLAALGERCRLLVGTNAANSNAAQVAAALERAGLAGSIERVFTVHELGARKPDPRFYAALQAQTGLSADQILMVGDDYRIDVTGAWRAGWRVAWYNPRGASAPALLPLHDVDITHLGALPTALQAPALPGLNECLSWLLQNGASAGLMAHVQAVAALAYQMAVWLRSAGQTVDPLLAHRGGLLHDLAKLAPAAPPAQRDHGALAAEMLLGKGQPALAEIARRHILHLILDAQLAPRTWEEKLVYLADKLVEGCHPVALEERLAALRDRYPQHAASIDAAAPAVRALQDELCNALNFPAGELAARLTRAMRDQNP